MILLIFPLQKREYMQNTLFRWEIAKNSFVYIMDGIIRIWFILDDVLNCLELGKSTKCGLSKVLHKKWNSLYYNVFKMRCLIRQIQPFLTGAADELDSNDDIWSLRLKTTARLTFKPLLIGFVCCLYKKKKNIKARRLISV